MLTGGGLGGLGATGVLGDHRWPIHGSLWTQRPTPGLVHNVRGLAYLVGRTWCKPEAGVTFEAQGPGVERGVICSYPTLSWGVQPPASCFWVPVLRDPQAWPHPQRPFDLGAPQLTLPSSGAPFLQTPRVGRAPLHLTSGVTVGAGRTAPTDYYLETKRQHRNWWPQTGDDIPAGAGPRRSAFAYKYTETHMF